MPSVQNKKKKKSPKQKVQKTQRQRRQKSQPTTVDLVEFYHLSCGEKLVKKGTVKIGTKKRTHYTVQQTPMKKMKGFIYRVVVDGKEYVIKTTKEFEL